MTQTIVQFLLERLDEDEAHAKRAYVVPPYYFADIAAKRRIIELHYPIRGFSPSGPVCAVCGEEGQAGYEAGVADWPCPTLKLLASVYADHPDFNPEWSVEPRPLNTRPFDGNTL